MKVPIVGRIAAGTPRTAYAQSDEYQDTPRSLVEGRGECFWLIVAGNSMNRLFPEGSLVLVDEGLEVRDGDVGVVFVNGYDATLQRVFITEDGIRLHPESYDPEYRDMFIRRDDPEARSSVRLGAWLATRALQIGRSLLIGEMACPCIRSNSPRYEMVTGFPA